MPLYELNGMHSHRHPFVGDGDDYEELIGDDELEDMANRVYLSGDVDNYFSGLGKGDAKSGTKDPNTISGGTKELKEPKEPSKVPPLIPPVQDKGFDIMILVSPVIAALATTTITYGVARTVQVDKKKAFKLSFIMGGFAGVSQIFGNWLKDKIEDLQKLQEAEQKLLDQQKKIQALPKGK